MAFSMKFSMACLLCVVAVMSVAAHRRGDDQDDDNKPGDKKIKKGKGVQGFYLNAGFTAPLKGLRFGLCSNEYSSVSNAFFTGGNIVVAVSESASANLITGVVGPGFTVYNPDGTVASTAFLNFDFDFALTGATFNFTNNAGVTGNYMITLSEVRSISVVQSGVDSASVVSFGLTINFGSLNPKGKKSNLVNAFNTSVVLPLAGNNIYFTCLGSLSTPAEIQVCQNEAVSNAVIQSVITVAQSGGDIISSNLVGLFFANFLFGISSLASMAGAMSIAAATVCPLLLGPTVPPTI